LASLDARVVGWVNFRVRMILSQGSGLLLLLGLACVLYFGVAPLPNALFWDENYYIPGADWYLLAEYHLHSHPPFGRILMAWGKLLADGWGTHPDSTHVRMVTYVPADLHLSAYRWCVALWSLSAVVPLWLLARAVAASPWVAWAVTLLYLLDNAMLLHFRGAMLDGVLLAMLAWSLWWAWLSVTARGVWRSLTLALLGLCLGLAVCTKVTGLIGWGVAFCLGWAVWRSEGLWAYVQYLFFATLYMALTVFAVFWLHTSLAVHFDSPVAQGYLAQTPPQHMAAVQSPELSVSKVLHTMQAYWSFMQNDHAGVAPLKWDDPLENGSPPWLWPLGGKAISYRWDSAGLDGFRYLYMVPNPVVWAVALLAVLGAACRLPRRLVTLMSSEGCSLAELQKNTFGVALVLGYFSYMLVMLWLDRVMYLYHYFPALLFALLLVADGLGHLERQSPTMARVAGGLVVLLALIVFVWLSPFTYHWPLTDADFSARNVFPWWGMRCAHCS